MEALLYLAKVNLYWVLFYLSYRLLLRNHTFFIWNRIYLVGSLLIAFILPLVTLPESVSASRPVVYTTANLPVYITNTEPVAWFSDWTHLLLGALVMGSLHLLLAFLKSIRDLRTLVNNGESVELDNINLVLLPHNKVGSFSFFKWLVMNKADYEQNFEPILRHESVHIRQLHSLDIILIELLKIIFWFNPVLWFYKHSIQEVHEFLADEHAPDRDGYARFLVAYAFNAPTASLTNHFFNGPLLKSRIKMIYKNRNSEWLRRKYFIILPLICFVVVMTAARKQVSSSIQKHAPAVVKAIVSEQDETPDFKAIESRDFKPKAEKTNTKSIKNQITKEFDANRATSKSYTSQIQDTVPAPAKKATFTNYRYAANIGPIAKVDSFPKIGTAITLRSYNGPASNALIIVDGVKQEQRGSIGYRQIRPDQIESINVLKNESAIDTYGAEGSEGVIIIKTKK
jgi:TonB-dependent SusC/RagA subfamily outer membrane receptor